MCKFIVITGGVISGIGKGVTASSIGLLLQQWGLTVTAIKIDPYLNLDAGTMSPYEHGETYVLADGGEVDLDLGNYERFLGIELTKDHNLTTGKVYQKVIHRERQGNYLGQTVQIVPHLTDQIQSWIIQLTNRSKPDICIIELGGTVGDMELAPFIEALRQMSGSQTMVFIHVSMIINNGELKTKPTQHSVSLLRTLGICPHLLVIRTEDFLPESIKQKIAFFCHLKSDRIISNVKVPNIYYVPQIFDQQHICQHLSDLLDLNLTNNEPNKKALQSILNYYSRKAEQPICSVGIAGKYTGSQDTYLSLIRALEHAGFYLNYRIQVVWINTENEDHLTHDYLNQIDRFIISGGFGVRGIEGKLKVAQYAREHSKPILGICLGMQVMIIEYALNVAKMDPKIATSLEWTTSSTTREYLITLLPDQNLAQRGHGGTMRLGNYVTYLQSDSLTHQIYQQTQIIERHRHRYELNDQYIEQLEQTGLLCSGHMRYKIKSDIQMVPYFELTTVVELPKHPFYLGCQFHPEFRSRNNRPHPLFIHLIKTGSLSKTKNIPVLNYLISQHNSSATRIGRIRDQIYSLREALGLQVHWNSISDNFIPITDS